MPPRDRGSCGAQSPRALTSSRTAASAGTSSANGPRPSPGSSGTTARSTSSRIAARTDCKDPGIEKSMPVLPRRHVSSTARDRITEDPAAAGNRTRPWLPRRPSSVRMVHLPTEEVLMAFSDWLFGRRLATLEEEHQRVGVLAGIPMLGLDALASAAYGPGGGADAPDPPRDRAASGTSGRSPR